MQILKTRNFNLRLIALIGLNLAGFHVFADDKKDEKAFVVPKSTLDATERRISTEQDPYKKLQLILRWIKTKEEYEKNRIFDSKSAKFKELNKEKQVIIDRIEKELASLYQADGLDIDALFRELGFRYLELRNYEKAIFNFKRIKNVKPEDYLALGDSLVANDQVNHGIEAYDQAGNEYRLKNVAAYKRAWAYLRLNNFVKALVEFDLSLKPNEHANNQLLEEAYNDRIRPYLETFQKQNFEQIDADEFRNLAKSVAKSDAKRSKDLYVKGLGKIVQGFTAKSEIELAQQVFSFVTQELDDTTEILLLSVPTWIKVYRGRLEHPEVKRIISSLPNQFRPELDTSELRTELYNTAVFYETFSENDEGQKVSRDILLQTYAKYFSLFQDDQDADALRFNYGKLLLEDGESKKCLEILAKRKKEESVEAASYSLEGKCELKYLDQLYVNKHDDSFYERLERVLLKDKIYKRPNLGLSEEMAFQGLTRMLTGSLSKNSKSEPLREALFKLVKNYPYSKEEPLFTELQITQAELRFKDLLEKNAKPSEKAPVFYEIYSESPAGTSVAEKSLVNSVLMGNDKETLDRCNEYRKVYGKSFQPSESIFNRCIHLAEHFLEIETEYTYWRDHERSLTSEQSLRLGLLEMALGKSEGRDRILSSKSDKATKLIESWDGVSSKKGKTNPSWLRLEKEAQSFVSTLSQIKFSQIQKEVPKKVKAYESIDAKLLAFFESDPGNLWRAKCLEQRSIIANKMSSWIEKLPEPPGLTPEEKTQYEQSSQEFKKPWVEGAMARQRECSEVAHSLDPEFTVSVAGYCPEDTSKSVLRKLLSEWRKTIQINTKVQQLIRILLNRAKLEENQLIARYFYFRALDLSKSDGERALAYLGLAKLTNKPRFWLNAAALDGGLMDPIEWLLEGAKGNPFYERLYGTELRMLRTRNRN